jgi:hypothetical protein
LSFGWLDPDSRSSENRSVHFKLLTLEQEAQAFQELMDNYISEDLCFPGTVVWRFARRIWTGVREITPWVPTTRIPHSSAAMVRTAPSTDSLRAFFIDIVALSVSAPFRDQRGREANSLARPEEIDYRVSGMVLALADLKEIERNEKQF